jgi:hypothetical protein
MDGGVDVKIHVFLTSALVAGQWSASRLDHFIPGIRSPSTHWMAGQVGPRAGMDDTKRRKIFPLSGFELQTYYKIFYVQFLIKYYAKS